MLWWCHCKAMETRRCNVWEQRWRRIWWRWCVVTLELTYWAFLINPYMSIWCTKNITVNVTDSKMCVFQVFSFWFWELESICLQILFSILCVSFLWLFVLYIYNLILSWAIIFHVFHLQGCSISFCIYIIILPTVSKAVQLQMAVELHYSFVTYPFAASGETCFFAVY